MAQDTILTGSKITAIANAIRTKGNTQAGLTLDQMPTAIANIPTSGGGFDWSQVKTGIRFIPDTTNETELDLRAIDTSTFKSINSMFEECYELKSLNVSGWDTSGIIDMGKAFSGCSHSSFNPDLSSWNVSNVLYMNEMFSKCYGAAFSASSIERWNVGKVTTMASMFSTCRGAAFNPDLSHWDTSHVTDMSYMFAVCSGASFNPNLGFDVSSVTNMSYMFSGCSGAAFNPDLSHWDTSHVTNMSYMFQTCTGTAFDPNLSGWDTSHVTSFNRMFQYCSNVKSIYLPDIDTSSATDTGYMFSSCTKLQAVIWATNKNTVQPITSSFSVQFAPNNTIFYVPDALVDTYKTTTNWSYNASRIKGVSELPDEFKTKYGLT